MAGLLSGVLPFVFSQGDRAKRYMNGLLADPIGTIQQTAGGIVDAGREQQGLLGRAFADPKNPFQVTDSGALDQAVGNVMAGPMGFAPARVIGPQSAALETARKNAVKMLGMPENNTPMQRAQAMGFDTPAAHFSRHGADVRELDSGKFAIAPFDAVGTHVGPEDQVLDRFNKTVGYKVANPQYAMDELKGVTYPVLIKGSRPMLDEAGNVMSETPLSMKFSERADYGNLRDSNARLRQEIFSTYDSIPYVNDVEAPGTISHIVPPQNIRSRFAAFDPARAQESDLLGHADPALLALLGLGGLGGAYAMNRDK